MSTAAQITDVTRTCQNDISTAALVGALEAAWSAIRAQHTEVPAAVLVVGSGSPTKVNQGMKWGHFAALRWQAGEQQLPEILISGEGLSREPEAVFTTLLHEATHALADVRGIQDTSRQGRWHNKKFATLAAELGLSTTKDDKLGYSPCTLTDLTRARYKATITGLAVALRFYRHPEPTGEGKQRTNNNNGVSCECECPRKLRISTTAFEEGPIVCALCSAAFLPEDIDRDTYEHPTFATGTPAGDDDQADDDSEDPMVFYDPTGERYGLPTYPFKFAPDGLLTRRQLRTRNLRPGGQDPAAQIMWRRGKRVAYLFRLDLAMPKRTATPAQLAAIDKALNARRTCSDCGQVQPYYIPRRTGSCLDCNPEVTR
ncbi:hypothetical protein HNR22_000034 [Micromonospora jinlongensis]|uniref:SprT-like family protein n=2 Tax=Micromonospora jinlongensis TaxID=1287877 RepID=A0A7Y9WVE7_9ACTN|nr:hypothetical protein [Micromonospora jinlongensis]